MFISDSSIQTTQTTWHIKSLSQGDPKQDNRNEDGPEAFGHCVLLFDVETVGPTLIRVKHFRKRICEEVRVYALTQKRDIPKMWDMSKPTMLERVRSKLLPLKGQALFSLEQETKISYDTLLRIRDSKVDPAFSKVQQLAEHFGLVGR